MIVALLSDLSHDWAQRVRRHLGHQAVILEGASAETTTELLQSAPSDLVITQMLSLTTERLSACEQMAAHAPDAVMLWIAPDEVIEKVRADELPAPDLWLRPSGSTADWEETISQAIENASLRAERGEAPLDPRKSAEGLAPRLERQSAPAMDVFHRLLAGLAGGFGLDHLLDAYTDAVTQFVRCATFCLLWEQPDPVRYTVRGQRGLRAEVEKSARLMPDDALPNWYRRNRRVVTDAELASWSDRSAALAVKRELDLFRGQVAVPLVVRGRLAGILMLGEKVLGDSYATGELEALFAMSSYVGLAAESIELHQELSRSKAYTERIVHTMNAGLITLGPDERIKVCNPYAAGVLGLDRSETEGADLRCLPSPLGDHLYGALKAPDAAIEAREVAILGGELTLRVSTAALVDDSGNVLGSVMLLDDITTEIELSRERSRGERLDMLTRIVGRIAHEVKNPLTAVKTYAELLDSRGSSEELTAFWSDTVRPEIDHLDDLIGNMVRMVEQRRPKLRPAQVEDLVNEAVGELDAAQDDGKGFFDVEVASGLPSVTVDPKPTRDALRYLLDYVAGASRSPVHIHVARGGDEDTAVAVTMRRLTRQAGSFEPEALFDPLYVMEHPETDLGPVIGEKIIASQRGKVEAACENGHVTMRITFAAEAAGSSQSLEVT